MSYLTAALSTAEINALSDPTKSYEDAFRDLEQITNTNFDESPFENGVRYRNTLDILEEQAKTAPDRNMLAVMLNCEYRLWKLDEETSIKYKPFLTHWVQALRRLEEDLTNFKQGTTHNPTSASDSLTAEGVTRARLTWIKGLLIGKDMTEIRSSSPWRTFSLTVPAFERPFDVQPYIQMLVETGVWDKPREPAVPSAPGEKQKPTLNLKMQSRKTVAKADTSSAPQQWQKTMRQKLKEQPDTAVQELKNLPLELSSLDFLTTLLTDRTLEAHSVETAPVIIAYIQHALRLVEKMEAPPSTSDQDSHANGAANGAESRAPVVEYGKEAQSRAVKLMLLFLKSLIRKGLLGTQVLYFEIQEICVRYVWIKEVRDFKSWVEEGKDAAQNGQT
ncbi:hypothetical protein EJ02DRAFT_456678 [Clathrospora elynae]|uniref:Uncharacterized protein n=1 Tax=Clathrospora elynae TaxID=706981 RepID=A0A6A5SGB1_9PLEO|nr:hypothetical protein EJ02DRAFT_456678 [Clathrospora elynae]